jgi:hypothetical protein
MWLTLGSATDRLRIKAIGAEPSSINPYPVESSMRSTILPVALLCFCGLGCVQTTTPSNTTPTVTLANPPLTLENFDKIKIGMTLQEVEAILGPPFATGNVDIPLPDGTKRKDVQSASWVKATILIPVGGGDAKQPEECRIVVELKGGKVTSKTQVGLK